MDSPELVYILTAGDGTILTGGGSSTRPKTRAYLNPDAAFKAAKTVGRTTGAKPVCVARYRLESQVRIF